jgi:hypothetical protein
MSNQKKKFQVLLGKDVSWSRQRPNIKALYIYLDDDIKLAFFNDVVVIIFVLKNKV